MSEPSDSHQDRWLLLTGCLLGTAAGLGFYLINLSGMVAVDQTALYLSVGLGAALGLLTLQRSSWPLDTGFALVLALLVGGLYKFAVLWIGLSPRGSSDFHVAYAVSGWALYLVPVVFYQTGRDAGGLSFPYRPLFLHAWNNNLAALTAGFFLLCCWLVLGLWGALFALLKINFFADLFRETWFIMTFSGLVLGLGIAVARERRTIIEGIRRIILALFRFITPVLGFIAVIFVATLLFTGLELLWKTQIAAAMILSIVYLFVFALNVVIQTGEERERLWRPAEWLVMAACLSLPLFAAIGAYALYLRIGQYGWTPDRFYAVCLIAVGGAYALGYALCVLLRRRTWTTAVTRLNPPLAIAVVVLALLVHLPGIEPFGWSARDQVARLLDGRVKASDFDFGYLRFKLGEAGQRAFADLADTKKITDDAAIGKEYARVAALEYYKKPFRTRLKDTAELQAMASYLHLLPAGAKAPPALIKAWLKNRRYDLQRCKREHQKGPRRCAMLRIDLDNDGRLDALLLNSSGNLLILLQDSQGHWRKGPVLIARDGRKKYKSGELLASLLAGKFRLAPHRLSDIIIGETRFE